MRSATIFSIILILIDTMVLFDFNTKSNISDWKIVNDVVMGGRSNGSFKLNVDGH